MGRPVYPHELKDPDFSWLISNYLDRNPGWVVVDRTLLPVVLINTASESPAELPAVSNGLLPAPLDQSVKAAEK